MNIMILRIQTFCFLQIALSQIEFQQYHIPDHNGYRMDDYPDYEHVPITYYAHHKSIFKDYNEYEDDFNECSCLCNTCVDLRPCCTSVCVNCVTPQSSVLFVPYVYPIIVTKNDKDTSDKKEETTTSTTLTTITTPTVTVEATTETITTTQAKKPDAKITLEDTTLLVTESTFVTTDNIPKTATDVAKGLYQFNDKNGKYAMTSFRRTKTNWLPKYGIVPIPDQLAEKILLQLRDIKVLHPTHMRRMDFLHKYNN